MEFYFYKRVMKSRKLLSEELHNFYIPPIIMQYDKSKEKRGVVISTFGGKINA
jgi:hypothetical protein